MNVTATGVVLFLHIAVAIVSFAFAGVLHVALIRGPREEDVREMRAWVPVIHRLEPLMPVAALALLATGAWLTELEDTELSWSDGWIVTSIVALVVVEALGATLMPRTKALLARIAEVGEGPPPADLVARWRDPVLVGVAHVATATFLGVVFLMAAKPNGAGSVISIGAFALVGAVSALPFVRHGATVSARPTGRPIAH